MSTLNKHSFFSIKWKAALLFGLLLFILNGLFPTLVYWNLQEQFEFSRTQIQQQFQQELIGQLQNTSEQIQRMAEISLIPLANHSDKNILNTLSQYQSKLELEWHITRAHIYDAETHKRGGWGDEIPVKIQRLISQVLNNEQALTTIDCSLSCQQYDLIPILHGSQVKHVLLLSYDMSTVLLNFTNKTAADIAVLSQKTNQNLPKDRFLANWDMEISALTSFNDNIGFLQQLSQEYSFNHIKQYSGIFRDSSLPIELQFISLNDNSDITFIIIDNIEQQQHEIISITLRSIAIALFSILILGAGLFFFISAPLSRLSTVSEALPLLAKQKYNDVKKLLQNQHRPHYPDELDLLEHSTHDLSKQLEQLQFSIKERSTALHSRSIELQQERDFVKSLIDTAQLIIITTDQNNQITSFNNFAERSTGYLEQDILKLSFQMFFPLNEWPEINKILLDLANTSHAVNQQESEFIRSDGAIRTISWLHSSLDNSSDLSSVLSVGLDITEKKQSEDKIIWLADHDSLTELYNRRRFNIEFKHILQQAIRLNNHGMLLFIDLDQFKDLNDSCGHHAGDKVLKKVSSILNSITRVTDVIARLGGDEFAIILPATDINGAITLSEKISEQLMSMNISFNNISYKITASIGIVQFPLADLSIDELLSNADLAMYQAKALGKNTWHQFKLDDQSRRQLESRVLWKQKIEYALENNHFIFHYQPILKISDHSVSHYEMLIRMQDEDGTIHSPATFIDIAEKTGLIHDIDHLVLQQGIIKQAELSTRNISLSLNLSAFAINDPVLFPLIKRLLKDNKVQAEHLIFELTETAAVADIDQAKELMQQLKTLGCRFSLDDFGTGFASFRYIRELPVDIVKIDGAFISNLVDNPDDQLFVKALVDIAKGMGKKTIAEFVENAETLALLKSLGVDYAQGFYIGKPQPYFLEHKLTLL